MTGSYVGGIQLFVDGGIVTSVGRPTMTTTTYAADRTALPIVDPYNDFMSETGKFYEAIRKMAEAVGFHDNVRRLLSAIRRRRPSGGGSHMQTMDMRIDDGRTWLRQLRHFVNRAACTLSV